MILAADLGGTKSSLALFEETDIRKPVFEKTFPTDGTPSFEGMLEEFLREAQGRPTLAARPTRAALGLAGAITGGRVRATVLPWVIDAQSVRERFGLEKVELLNDLIAAAYGCLAAQRGDYVELCSADAPSQGTIAVLAAGTYLGTAFLVQDPEGSYIPTASEGSYADFSPHDGFQWELMGFLMRERSHVMKKEVLSGQGLENIHRFLIEKSGEAVEEWFLEESRGKPVSAVIIESGLSGRCEICSETLDRFVGVLAAEAGNLAATLMATGGVYITGGVAPRFRERFEGPLFQRAFLERGVLTPVMEKIPVRLVTNPGIPLLGAAWYARHRM